MKTPLRRRIPKRERAAGIGKRMVAALILLSCVFCHLPLAHAEILVRFDRDKYFVRGQESEVPIRVLIDADNETRPIEKLAAGLFSFGVRVGFNGDQARFFNLDDLQAAPPLDFFEFSPGAFEQTGPGFGGIKGNIDQAASPLDPYGGIVLGEFSLTNLAPRPAAYSLTLDFFETLPATEQIFLDGNGVVLDDQIVFGTASVIVGGLSADFDKDGDVDGNDFLIWQDNFGERNHTSNEGDTDGDGDVDGNDFLNWQDQFGEGVTGSSQVPEPHAVILALILCGAALSVPGRSTSRERREP